jgi:uncharacterized membrane protein YfhO
VVIEPDETGALPPSVEEPATDDRARVVPSDDPDELVIDATLARPGLLVVADTYYPGWEARVDGTPVPVHPANLMFRAVPVPAGTHTVTFRYRPRPFRAGIALSLLAAGICSVLAVRSQNKRARW